MAFNAGNAFITISPDMSKFTKDIKAKFADQGEEAAKSFSASFKAALGSLDAKVKADADTTAAKAKLDDLTKTRTAKVKVSVDKEGLKSLALPALAVGGTAALGPTALASAAVLTGIGVAAGAAVGGLAAFAAVAKGPVTAALKANQDAAKGDLKALQALSPAGRELAADLAGLTSAWAQLQKAETPVISSALSPWVSAATSGMRLLSPVVEDVAGAVQFLGTQADAAIKSPFWDKFASAFGQTAAAGVEGFGDALGHVADGFAHIFVDFAPDLQKLPGLVDDWAASFDTWAKSYNASGLEDFVSKTFSPANREALKTDLANLATALGNVGKALQNMSPAAFSGLSNVLAILAKLSPDQIESIAALYAVSKTVGGASNLTKLVTGAAGLSLGSGTGKSGKLSSGLSLGISTIGGALIGGNLAGGIAEAAHPANATQVKQFQSAVPAPLLGFFGGAQGAASLLAPVTDLGAPRQPAAVKGAHAEPMPGTPAFAAYQDKVQGSMASPIDRVWSTSYEDFQRDFAGPLTAWFTQSLPDAFTKGIPDHVWSPAYEGFQRDFAGPMTSWFTSSLPNFFVNSIPQNVWSPAYENFQRDVAGPLTSWFTSSLPNFFTSAVPGAWDWAYQGFENVIGSPVAAWFTESVPHFFTSAVPGAWAWAFQGFMSTVGSPVASWFGTSVPHFFTSAVPSAWSWAWTGFMGTVGSPVAAWFSQSVPHFFTSAVPSAWSWAWTGFMSAVGTPVANWFSQSVPHFFTSAVPGAFSWAWSEFQSNVISPITSFFTSTLPSLASSALGTAKSILGTVGSALGFASGTNNAPPGWFWVGEHGPELMRFAGGEQVLPHMASVAKAQSLAALGVPSVPSVPRLPGVSSALKSGGLQLQLSWAGTSDQVTNAIVSGLQAHVIGATGGDVQAAIGYGPIRLP